MNNVAEQSTQPLQNAAEVIERFGGIRPMAAKVKIAVTTVQGWKKRGVIPANRVDTVIESAKANNINIADLLGTPSSEIPAPANESVELKTAEKQLPESNIQVEAIIERPAPVEQKIGIAARQQQSEAPQEKPQEPRQEPRKEYTELRIESDRKTVTRGSHIVFGLIGVVMLGGVIVMWPQQKQQSYQQQLASFEKQVQSADESTTFKGLVPDNWKEQLSELKGQAETAAQDVQDELLGTETTPGRLQELETYVSEIGGQPLFAGLASRFDTMEQSSNGQETLEGSMDALYTMLATDGTVQDTEAFNARLHEARLQNEYLTQTLGDVPPEDLRAAAMLLAMSQMRSNLNRNDVPFAEDLQTLRSMVDPSDEELLASLDKLTPYAEEGIASPKEVSNEFRALSENIVESSLSGEDVPLVERARARMNDMFQVEKGGELVTGTETQMTVSKAQNLLDNGELAMAIELLNENLDAAELAPLRPWIRRAQSALSARDVKQAIERAMDINTSAGHLKKQGGGN